MAQAEFEEKQFEVPMNIQLLQNNAEIFAPGQVLENHLGFDVAVNSPNPLFWSLWGMGTPAGQHPQAGWWTPLPPTGVLPPMMLNAFIQYKRPEAISPRGRRAKEWPHWRGAYYRFDVVRHQQQRLEQCAAGLGANGLVVYAAPAFHRNRDLWNHTMLGTLVSNSNFVEALRLRGHSRWTYSAAGILGRAYSDPEDIEKFDFIGAVRRAVADGRKPEPRKLSTTLRQLL